MHRRSLGLAVGGTLVVGLALAGVLLRPASARSQATIARPVGRFQLGVLPGATGEFIVLDTETGEVVRWRPNGDQDYLIDHLRPGMNPGAGWQREVIELSRK